MDEEQKVINRKQYRLNKYLLFATFVYVTLSGFWLYATWHLGNNQIELQRQQLQLISQTSTKNNADLEIELFQRDRNENIINCYRPLSLWQRERAFSYRIQNGGKFTSGPVNILLEKSEPPGYIWALGRGTYIADIPGGSSVFGEVTLTANLDETKLGLYNLTIKITCANCGIYEYYTSKQVCIYDFDPAKDCGLESGEECFY